VIAKHFIMEEPTESTEFEKKHKTIWEDLVEDVSIRVEEVAADADVKVSHYSYR
jgi:L-rhamnose mutarotase